jgi:hypothetical protein
MQPNAIELQASNVVDGGAKLRLLTLNDLDGRTAAARRVRELIADLESDLGGGSNLTRAQAQLVQRAAVLGALIENAEATWAAGGHIDIGEYLAGINAQRRVLATLGLERRMRDVTPNLSDYLRTRATAS